MEKETIRNIIAKQLDYPTDFKFFDLMQDTIDRIDFDCDEDELEEECNEAIDSALIYYCDQWTIYQYYCTPRESFDSAVEMFTIDVFNIAREIKDTL